VKLLYLKSSQKPLYNKVLSYLIT